MAEFCRKCFIESFYPSKYEIDHIVMSEECDLCEGCGRYVPVVVYIDDSEVI